MWNPLLLSGVVLLMLQKRFTCDSLTSLSVQGNQDFIPKKKETDSPLYLSDSLLSIMLCLFFLLAYFYKHTAKMENSCEV